MKSSCSWLIVITNAGKLEVCLRFEAMLLISDLNVKIPFIQIPVQFAHSWDNVGGLDKPSGSYRAEFYTF